MQNLEAASTDYCQHVLATVTHSPTSVMQMSNEGKDARIRCCQPYAARHIPIGQHDSTRRTLIVKQEDAAMELVDGQDFPQEDSQEDQESFYKPWIEQDFAVWGKDGIKQVRPAE